MVVDAVAGLAPGEIWVRPLAALVDRARSRASGAGAEPRSSHELPIDAVLTLAATLRAAPPPGTFVGIGGSRWDVGAPLSPAVAAPCPRSRPPSTRPSRPAVDAADGAGAVGPA